MRTMAELPTSYLVLFSENTISCQNFTKTHQTDGSYCDLSYYLNFQKDIMF